MTETFQCPTCGAPLHYDPGDDPVISCKYCGNSITVPAELRSQPVVDSQPQGMGVFVDMGDMISQASRFKEVKELVGAGQDIEAIKLYRQLTGLGLKEAKDAIDDMKAGKPLVITQTSFSSAAQGDEIQYETFPGQIVITVSSHFSEARLIAGMGEVKDLMQSGEKIEAIKRYRELTGLGLKEAKDAVEAMMAGKPVVIKQADFGTSIPGGDVQFATPSGGTVITVTSQQTTQALKTAAKASAVGGGVIGCTTLIVTIGILLLATVPILFALAQKGGPLHGVWLKVNPAAKGRVVQSFGAEGNGPGLFLDPRNIAVDAQGQIYVADFDSGRIQRFDAQGNYQSQWSVGTEKYITGMSAARDGTVYVVYDGSIWRYDGLSGELLGQVAVPGFEFGPYIDDVVVTADGNLVAITEGDTALKLSPDGELLQTIPDAIESVSNDSELDTHPAADGLGNLFLLGTFNNGVFQYTPEGRFVNRFGSDGDEKGQFTAAGEIAVDGYGQVYVSDMKGIQVFSPDGRFLHLIEAEGYPFGMVFTGDNELLVVTNTPAVYRYQVEKGE